MVVTHHPRRLHQAHAAGNLPRSRTAAAAAAAAPSTRGDDIVTRSFNAHTHQWVLFFSSGGKAFREKVWRLPEGGPTGKGRALVNLLPELGADTITTVLPLPQDETLWDSLHLVFATAQGNVRRNRLSDFRNVRATGLIAMKLDEGDRPDRRRHLPRGRRRAAGHAPGPLHPLPGHRRHAARVRRPRQLRRARHPAGRASADEVISLSVLRHVEASNEERVAYLAGRRRAAGRATASEERGRSPPTPSEGEEPVAEVSARRRAVRRTGSRRRKSCSPSPTPASASGRSAYEYRVTRPRRAGDCQHHADAAHRHARSPRPSRCGRATT